MDDTKTTSSKLKTPNKVQQDPGADLTQLTREPTESFDEIVEEYEAKQDDYQAMYNAGGKFKKGIDEIAEGFEAIARQAVASSRVPGGVEREPQRVEAARGKAVEEVTEIPTEPEIERKVEGYIEKVEKAGETQQVVVDDYTQQILLKPTGKQNVKVTLPLTEDQIEKGLHMQIWNSIRWLAEWCMRQIKMLKDRVVYKG
jgi:hypothetical protein